MILHNTNIITFLFLLPLLAQANQRNLTRNNENHLQPSKPKRFLSNQMYNQGEAKAVLFYMENPQNGEVPELQTAASSTGYNRNLYPTSGGKPLAVVSVQQPIQVFEQDTPKQVAEQQVLYEFQQTPNNAVSNVQVKQLFQPDVTNLDGEQLPTAQPLAASLINNQPYTRYQQPQQAGSSYYPATSATLVSPSVYQNGYSPNQGLTSSTPFIYNNPLFNGHQQYSTSPIKQQQSPGKSIYLNGKIVYNPAHHIIQQGKIIPPNSIYNKGIYHNQQKLPLITNNHNYNYGGQLLQQQQQRQNNIVPGINYNNRINEVNRGQVGAQSQEKLAPNSYLPPITRNNRFQPPKHLQQIDKPSAPVQQQQEEGDNDEDAEATDEENEGDVEEGEEDFEENDADGDEDDAHRGYGDDDSYGYETFQFEDEYLENDDAHFLKPPRNKAKRHRNEDESDYDHKRSRNYPKNHSRRYRNQPKYESGDNYGYYEGYSTNMKYKSPSTKSKTSTKSKPIGKYKKVKFSKVKGGKPRVETIEGRFSEQVPVTHRQKLYKERWYVTQDADGAKNKKT